ncbi:pyridoxamine 5'-phosphate oxidase family protein [Pedobacter sp. P351]|uniref:pyridoxamine 5'-phosphate oxidase family protein n=1 Tax=Pedobacter superstes TaxID=3133441 RepID=UPI00309EF4CA
METSQHSGLEKLKNFINNGDVAMLCSLQADNIHSRPMVTSDIDEEGNIWFFTNEHSPKVNEVGNNQKVTLCYTDHDNGTYVSVNGLAAVVNDPLRMKKLFNSMVKTFFPEGLNDPKLALLKVHPTHAEYWDSNSNSMVRFMGILGSALTGDEFTRGKHGEIDF